MFDVGFWEMAIIGVIALLVIGPERLPKAARMTGLWIGKARRMISDVKADIRKEMREEDLRALRDLKQEVGSAADSVMTIARDTHDSLGIREVGEAIKSSVSEVKSGISDGTGALTESTGRNPAPGNKAKTGKKKSSAKKAPRKKTAAKKQRSAGPASKKAAAKKKATSSRKKTSVRQTPGRVTKKLSGGKSVAARSGSGKSSRAKSV